ncbi:MAG TPA: HAMP domain-containing sensor histidine kinase [Acidimicrobiia bacterium]|nr:HAMP domain-containing sensor histidine kinase [Acidimicrobiia bacterium]
MSLRTRLSLLLVVLAAVGLVVAGYVTHRATRTYLVDRVDGQLEDSLKSPQVLFPNNSFGAEGRVARTLPPGTFAELRDSFGNAFESTDRVLQNPPELPDEIEPGKIIELDNPHFRVTAGIVNVRAGPQVGQALMVVAIPMRDVDETLSHLRFVELVVAAIVLAALALLGWLIVRRELRPLEQMAETAGAIAAGDLTQRVEYENETNEVGRLGVALNAMLGQIEAAFAEREASESKLRQFVGDASHELRTPLTSIRGYAELFRRGAADRPEDLDKAMRRIEEEAVRMGVLVDDLLLLARLDQGRPLQRDTVDLAQLATDAVDDARAATPARDITYVANGAVTVTGDEARLRQVLANLLSNACAHAGPDAHVACTVHTDNGDAVIEVRDDGPGMSADDAAHVFERFWRADKARTRSSGGAGLGLSIVAAIAEAHGGKAEVETAPGQGAVFRVRVPAATPTTL